MRARLSRGLGLYRRVLTLSLSPPPAPIIYPEAMEKSQRLGEDGDVDGSLMLSQQAEAYKKQHEEMYKRLSAPDRVMTVCKICGVFIHNGDEFMKRLVSRKGGRREGMARWLGGKKRG